LELGGGVVTGRPARARTAARDRRRGRRARRMGAGRSRAYGVAVWGLWAVACLLLGLTAPFAWWLSAALLQWPPPPGAELLGLLAGGGAFALTAPWVRVQLRRHE
jgi:hypothetical protein